MSCFDNYITIDESTPSRSGLYAHGLPGIDSDLLDGIARNVDGTPDEDHDDIWATIYKRARRNLVSDVGKQLQDKFFVDLKLVTRETSEFQSGANTNTGLAGITIEYNLPKYARLHIISIGVFSSSGYSAGDVFKIYDTDEDGELLETVNSSISAGRNTINVDSDFEVDKVFISYNPQAYSFRTTENKYFPDSNYLEFGDVVCEECFYSDVDFWTTVQQINGGGVNVKFMIYCSDEKFVCENLKLFEDAFLYKIGHEILIERRLGERLTKYTVMTQDRWDEQEAFYKANYERNLMNVMGSLKIPEDDICFACKSNVRTEKFLP